MIETIWLSSTGEAAACSNLQSKLDVFLILHFVVEHFVFSNCMQLSISKGVLMARHSFICFQFHL